jgi:hypothetical protein
MPRRASFIAFLGLVVALVFVTGLSAGAAPDESVQAKEAEVIAAQERLMEIRLGVSAAQASYDNALYEMNHLNGQIARASRDLEAAKKRVAEAEENLEERASQVYRSGNVAFVDVLVGRILLRVRVAAGPLDEALGEERDEFVAVREAKTSWPRARTIWRISASGGLRRSRRPSRRRSALRRPRRRPRPT